MANALYTRGLNLISTLDLAAQDVRCLLLGGASYAYTYDATDNFVSDLTPGTNELSGTGYARVALAGETYTEDDANFRSTFDANDVAFGALNADNGLIQAVVLFIHTGSDATAQLIAFFDTINPALPFTTDGSAFTVTWNAAGIFTLSNA